MRAPARSSTSDTVITGHLGKGRAGRSQDGGVATSSGRLAGHDTSLRGRIGKVRTRTGWEATAMSFNDDVQLDTSQVEAGGRGGARGGGGGPRRGGWGRGAGAR